MSHLITSTRSQLNNIRITYCVVSSVLRVQHSYVVVHLHHFPRGLQLSAPSMYLLAVCGEYDADTGALKTTELTALDVLGSGRWGYSVRQMSALDRY